MVPTFFLSGCTLIMISYQYNELINIGGPGASASNKIYYLTFIYFIGTLFMATGDVAIDGWAISLFSRENTALVGICGRFGGAFGFFIGFNVALLLHDPEFCQGVRTSFGLKNSSNPLMTFDNCIYYTGLVYFLVSLIIAVIKEKNASDLGKEKETDQKCSDSELSVLEPGTEKPNKPKLTTKQTYLALYQIATRYSVLIFFIFIFSYGLSNFMVSSAYTIKLVQIGYKKSDIAKLGILQTVNKLVTPWLFYKKINNGKPLKLHRVLWFVLLVFSVVGMVLLYYLEYTLVPSLLLESNALDAGQENITTTIAATTTTTAAPVIDENSRVAPPDVTFSKPWFYLISTYLLSRMLVQTIVTTCFISYMPYIADPFIAGSAITLFNTISNTRWLLFDPIYMWFLDFFGFYNFGVFMVVSGFVLFFMCGRVVDYLTNLPREGWYYERSEDVKEKVREMNGNMAFWKKKE